MDAVEKRPLIATIVLYASALALAILVLVPILDLIMVRVFWSGFPEAAPLTEYSLLALAFLSAAYATWSGGHLVLNSLKPDAGRAASIVNGAVAFIAASVNALLCLASLSLALIGFEPQDKVFGLPMAVFVSPMAIGFLFMAVFTVMKARGGARVAAALGIPFGLFLAMPAVLNMAGAAGLYSGALDWLANASYTFAGASIWPLAISLVVLAFFGLPLYAVLAGAAALLFLASGSSIELIPSEANNLFMNDSMPAIPLFTVAGFILSESKAGKRLVGVFRELVGWIPGGEAFAAVLVCAFFTTFTGANGVTILALGGLLAFILLDTGGYDEHFAHGLLTSSASIGLLFPPSIAVILYAVNAQFVVQGESSFTITDMFLGGLLPGILLVLAMGGFGVVRSIRAKTPTRKFDVKAAGKAVLSSLPEILIPAIILVLYLTGTASLTEISAIILVYVLVLEGPIRKELDQGGIVGAAAKALPVAGGALIIIAAARGLSFFTMEAGLPEAFAAWMTTAVSSRFLFLLFLNLALLVVGCFMDIFSAVLIVSPLIIPLGAAYGVHPVHLGVIFITNLSIGFLTPPIGMNLFLASYAFGKPVMKIFRDVLPFFIMQLVILALVTWVPWFSLALIGGGR